MTFTIFFPWHIVAWNFQYRPALIASKHSLTALLEYFNSGDCSIGGFRVTVKKGPTLLQKKHHKACKKQPLYQLDIFYQAFSVGLSHSHFPFLSHFPRILLTPILCFHLTQTSEDHNMTKYLDNGGALITDKRGPDNW